MGCCRCVAQAVGKVACDYKLGRMWLDPHVSPVHLRNLTYRYLLKPEYVRRETLK